MEKPLVVFGAGGHAKAVIDAAHASGKAVSLVLDDHPTCETFLGIPMRHPSECLGGGFRFVVAIGCANTRRLKFNWLLSIGGEPETIIHPRASVSELAEIGRGSVVLPMAHIDPCVSIGENCIVNVAAVAGHDSILGDDVHLSANACLGGACRVGNGAWIGLGASVQEGTTIGENALVGLGAMVSKDVPPNHKAISPHRKEAIILPIAA